MRRAGTCFFAFACLMSCTDLRDPLVFEAETPRSEASIIACLEGYGSLGEAAEMPNGGTAVTVGVDHRTWRFDAGPQLSLFDEDDGSIRFKIRSKEPIPEEQRMRIQECATGPM